MNDNNSILQPDFIGIGVQRAGTSWLYHALNAHPDIYLPAKEIHFFDEKYSKGIDWYFSLFDSEVTHKVKGEFTPNYISEEHIMERLHQHCPNTKILVMLRDPFERAYSAYNLYKAHGRFQGLTFDEAASMDKGIISNSLYSDQIEHVFKLFPKTHVCVLDFDDIAKEPYKLIQRIYKFLEVDSDFVPPRLTEKYNVGGNAKIQNALALPKIQKRLRGNAFGRQVLKIKKIKFVNDFKEWVLDKEVKKDSTKNCSSELREKFKADLVRLGDILNKDFSKWY